MDISYDYYRIFYYVARCGSFSRAAATLLRGQPNITKAIARLEGQLGCKLFIRSSKGVTLTPEGEKLYRHAQIAFEHLESAENEILTEQNLEGGTVSIAVTEIALHGSVLPALDGFIKDYPNVKIRLTNHTTPQALAALKNGLADFAVVTLNNKDIKNFRITEIKHFHEILCCKKGYIEKNEDARDIFNHPLISLGRDTYSSEFFREYLLQFGVNRDADIEVATTDQILPLIKRGIGLGFIPEFIADEPLSNGEIEEINLCPPPKERYICFAENQKQTLSAAAKKFREYLKI